MKIAILDDNEILAQSIKKFFLKDWHEVDLFYSKKEFMELTSFFYDIYLLDIDLPDWSWLEIAKELRTQKDVEEPILMISANSGLETKLEWFEIWIDDYIVKPFSPLEIEARIKAIIWKTRKLSRVKKNLEYKEIVFDRNMRKVQIKWEEIELTKAQKLVLEQFLLNQDRPVSILHLSETIWRTSLDTTKTNEEIESLIDSLKTELWSNFQVNEIDDHNYILENSTNLTEKITLNNIMCKSA